MLMKKDYYPLENYLTENNRFLLDTWPTRMKNDLDVLCFDSATILPWKPSKNSWGLGGQTLGERGKSSKGAGDKGDI